MAESTIKTTIMLEVQVGHQEKLLHPWSSSRLNKFMVEQVSVDSTSGGTSAQGT